MSSAPPAASNVYAKRDAFRQLHASGCFVIPNRGTWATRATGEPGFKALATTSSGFAWSCGRPDNGVTFQDVLRHLGEMAAGVDVPVNADFEGGFAVEPAHVAENVRRAVTTGVAGLSIEDSTGDAASPLFEFGLGVERVRAAVTAVVGTGALLVARSEGFIAGRPDLAETIRRLTAYAEAGADCLYAPGIRSRDDIAAVVRAVTPKPVNVLVTADWTTVADLAALGVRRISVGGALARAAWGGFMAAATDRERQLGPRGRRAVGNRGRIIQTAMNRRPQGDMRRPFRACLSTIATFVLAAGIVTAYHAASRAKHGVQEQVLKKGHRSAAARRRGFTRSACAATATRSNGPAADSTSRPMRRTRNAPRVMMQMTHDINSTSSRSSKTTRTRPSGAVRHPPRSRTHANSPTCSSWPTSRVASATRARCHCAIATTAAPRATLARCPSPKWPRRSPTADTWRTP
jgi:methylisocitrate lyase